MPKVNTDEDSGNKWTGRFFEGSHTGGCTQTRFTRIPDSHLNAETVAGVRDMNLGRIKNGKPTGAPIIRCDTGNTSGAKPHINIDPKGRPEPTNPHIEVSAGTIKTAEIVNKTLKYGGIALTVAAVAIDSWRIFSAMKDDIYVRDHACEIIKELGDAIRQLNKLLETETSFHRKKELRMTIEHLEKVLKDVKRTKSVPVKFIKTTSSIAGGWTGGIAGGSAGAWGGAQTGAIIGTCFGPVGTVVGAPIGAVIGGLGGGILGGILGSATAEVAAEKGLELAD